MSSYLGGTQYSYGSRVADMTPEQIEQNARDALNLTLDATPVVGEIKSGKEGIEDFQQGNYLMGSLGLLGAIPLLGYGPRAAKGLLSSAGNFGNQVAANMPTLIDGFYSGTPYTSFLRDAIAEVQQNVQQKE